MSLLEVIILSIIQGFTEFIPVSSSGHLALIPELLGWSEHPTSFDIVLHGGTLLALIIFFRKKLKRFFFSKSKDDKSTLKLLLIGSIPTIIISLLVVIGNRLGNDAIDNLLKTNYIMIFMLISVGLVLFFADKIFSKSSKEIKNLNNKNSLIVGLLQSLALVRGTSRSGITLIAGQLQGLKKEEALEFGFLLGIPIIGLSFIYQIFDFVSVGLGEISIFHLSIGFIISLISGLLAIKFMMVFIKNHSLKIFGLYRILLGVLAILILYIV